MKLCDLISENARPSIPNPIIAYHGGTGFKGHFDLKYSGTGEGYRILGPGMYFTTHKASAAGYAKSHARSHPTVYTVEINTDNFYNNLQIPSDKTMASLDAIAKELGYTYETLPSNSEPLTYGSGGIGDIVRVAGHKKAQQLFIKHGLNGAVELLPGSIWEICVFNLNHVKVLNAEPLTGE